MIRSIGPNGFEFNYSDNVIFSGGKAITLSPHEADILRILLNHRTHPTPISTLIQQVIFGGNQPDDHDDIDIRVAIASLRKKIRETGIVIREEPKVGFEIEASHIPGLNRRLIDKILLALKLARSTDKDEIAKYLEAALNLAEAMRQKPKRARTKLPVAAAA